MRLLISVALLCIILFAGNVKAQEFTPSIRWTGDVRVRSEVDLRDFNQKTAANTFTLLRSRLGFEALPIENARVFIQLRDSRVFGQEKDATGTFNTISDSKNIDLHQGFIEVKKLLLDDLTLRLGRMTLSYGNQRLIGAVEWHNIGRSFDGGLVRLDFEDVGIDCFAMNTGEVQPYVATAVPGAVARVKDFGSDFYGAYANIKTLAPQKLDAYFLYQTHRDTTGSGKSELSRFTTGVYSKGKAGEVDFETELAYQFGDRRGATVSAFILTGKLGYPFQNLALSWLGAGYEILSGTPAGDATYKSFDAMYATGHKFHGSMDYFINIPATTNNRGLQDAFVNAVFTWSDKTTTNVWLHHFSLATESNGKKALGQECDVVTQYKHNKNLEFEIGVASFVPAALMAARFAGPDVGLWGYVMTTVSF